MATKTLPPRVLIRQILLYDPETGKFSWKPRPRELFKSTSRYVSWNNRFVGKPAGWVNAGGRPCLTIMDAKFYAYRIAWLYEYGEPVPDEIDHADCDPMNTRIENLRAADSSQNKANAPMLKNNTTGAKGVTRMRDRYMAQIGFQGDNIYLGTFDTVQEAAKAYRAAAIKLFGEFARWE